MTRNEIIDAALIALDKAAPGRLMLGEYCIDIGLGDRYAFELRDALLAEDLARSLDPNTHMVITDRGRQVLSVGGWLKVCQHNEEQVAKQIERERIEDEKLRDDAKISKWQVKTRWWPLIISAASFIISVVALVKPMLTEEATVQPKESKNEVVEVSPSSIDTTKQVVHFPNADTLK